MRIRRPKLEDFRSVAEGKDPLFDRFPQFDPDLVGAMEDAGYRAAVRRVGGQGLLLFG